MFKSFADEQTEEFKRNVEKFDKEHEELYKLYSNEEKIIQLAEAGVSPGQYYSETLHYSDAAVQNLARLYKRFQELGLRSHVRQSEQLDKVIETQNNMADTLVRESIATEIITKVDDGFSDIADSITRVNRIAVDLATDCIRERDLQRLEDRVTEISKTQHAGRHEDSENETENNSKIASSVR
jgi:uncharacterized membrane protein YheB (UPF0754 family)